MIRWGNVGTRLLLNGQFKEPAAPGSDGLTLQVTMGSNKHPGFATERWKDLQGPVSKALETNQVDCCKRTVKNSPVKRVCQFLILYLLNYLAFWCRFNFLWQLDPSLHKLCVSCGKQQSPHLKCQLVAEQDFLQLLYFFLFIFWQALQTVSSTFQTHQDRWMPLILAQGKSSADPHMKALLYFPILHPILELNLPVCTGIYTFLITVLPEDELNDQLLLPR